MDEKSEMAKPLDLLLTRWSFRISLLEPVSFAKPHCTGPGIVLVEHLYPLKRFRLND